jgi:preprotein translocase subunit SecF
MSWLRSVGGRLYRGEVSFDFVGRKKLWYALSGLILVVSVAALATRGLDYSIDFKGGSLFEFKAPATATRVTSVVTAAGGGPTVTVTEVGTTPPTWQAQTSKLSSTETFRVQHALEKAFHATVSPTFIGPSWGTQISHKALEGLIAFLIAIVIYLSIAFEWKMAAAALTALAHDIVITTGVYALTGFQVSPSTVIGLLTILGYSLYDTVVVFDKVRENTAGLLGTARSTYSQAANLALNQTLVRSINTSLIALLPVTAILVVSVNLLGNGELKDLALVLFVGMLSGTYSSICIATPVLATLKEREPQYQALAKRVALRASGGRAAQRAKARAAKAGGAAGAANTAAANTTTAGAVAVSDGADDGYDGAVAATDAAEVADAVAGADEAAGVAEAAEPAGASPDERVPAGRAASGSAPRGASGARPGPRQQPRRSSAAKRRPAGKKKRR